MYVTCAKECLVNGAENALVVDAYTDICDEDFELREVLQYIGFLIHRCSGLSSEDFRFHSTRQETDVAGVSHVDMCIQNDTDTKIEVPDLAVIAQELKDEFKKRHLKFRNTALCVVLFIRHLTSQSKRMVDIL